MHWFIWSTACERNMQRMTLQKSRDILIMQLHCYSGVKQIMYKTRIVIRTNTDIFHVSSLIFSYDFLNISITMMTLDRKLLTRALQYKQHKGNTNKNMQHIFTTTPSDSKLSHELRAYARNPGQACKNNARTKILCRPFLLWFPTKYFLYSSTRKEGF
jgi:hypothetical protein